MSRTLLLKIEPPTAPMAKAVVWRIVAARWKVLVPVTIAGALLGLSLSFLFRREYRAEAVAEYAQTSSLPSSLQNLAGGLGGLASLAGITLNSGDNSALARTMLESRLVSQKLIEQYKLMPQLFPRDWDEQEGKWKGDKEDWPTIQKGIEKFQKKHLTIDYDNLDNKVKVGVLWWDRELAARIANSAITVVNDAIRTQAQQEAERTSAYLEEELNKTSSVEMRTEIFAVMRQQMETAMYANVRTEYALQSVDPAVAPDGMPADRPNRIEFSLIGAAGLLLLVILGYIRRESNSPSVVR